MPIEGNYTRVFTFPISTGPSLESRSGMEPRSVKKGLCTSVVSNGSPIIEMNEGQNEAGVARISPTKEQFVGHTNSMESNGTVHVPVPLSSEHGNGALHWKRLRVDSAETTASCEEFNVTIDLTDVSAMNKGSGNCRKLQRTTAEIKSSVPVVLNFRGATVNLHLGNNPAVPVQIPTASSESLNAKKRLFEDLRNELSALVDEKIATSEAKQDKKIATSVKMVTTVKDDVVTMARQVAAQGQ